MSDVIERAYRSHFKSLGPKQVACNHRCEPFLTSYLTVYPPPLKRWAPASVSIDQDPGQCGTKSSAVLTHELGCHISMAEREDQDSSRSEFKSMEPEFLSVKGRAQVQGTIPI